MSSKLWQNPFLDKNGKLVVFQRPNAPLIVWIFASLIARLIDAQPLHIMFVLVAIGALIAWALLEIFYGSNTFRRTLGLIVLTNLVVSNML